METILVPLDGSAFGEHALSAAVAIARRGGLGIALAHVHHVVPATSPAEGAFFGPDVDVLIREQETTYLEDVTRRLAAVWDGPVSHSLLEVPIADALCQQAQELRAALIVLCTHGRGGVTRAWLGSVADRMIRQSPIPVLVVHPAAAHPDLAREPSFEHILIPLDGSSLAEQAIDQALWIGRLSGARYTLLRVVEPITHGFFVDGTEPSVDVDAEAKAWHEASDYLKGIAGRLRAQGLTVSTETRIGNPANEILAVSGGYDVGLIAMATHGRGGVSRLLLGSVADKVLRGASVPLLVSRLHELPTSG